ncbi:MAG: hypothetical protein JWO98_5453 [Frankiales bacterium]|nr:hypothetical protein [Frankiales bacterium]
MGKTIKIYLANESVSGIRHAEIDNWSGQALACPRSRFQELREWPELQRPGVYLLFGVDDESGDGLVYVGEAEVVIDRVSSHMSGKDFWTEVVAFTSKDLNLTKAHVRYLEARLLSLAKQAGRYRITNGAVPQLPSLPRSDRDSMEGFLVSVKMLLPALGHKVLEALVSPPRRADIPSPQIDPLARIVSQLEGAGSESILETSPVFHLRVASIHARAVRTDEGMVVFEGSEAIATTFKSITGSMMALRQALIESGALVQSGANLRLTRDHLFKSPSQAGGVMAGYSINGREYWRLEDGTTYAKYETRQSELLAKDLGAA